MKACEYAKNNNMDIISFSGFEKDNPLSKKGDINFWIDSDNYNIIENSHQVLLLTLIDYISNKKY